MITKEHLLRTAGIKTKTETEQKAEETKKDLASNLENKKVVFKRKIVSDPDTGERAFKNVE